MAKKRPEKYFFKKSHIICSNYVYITEAILLIQNKTCNPKLNKPFSLAINAIYLTRLYKPSITIRKILALILQGCIFLGRHHNWLSLFRRIPLFSISVVIYNV